MYKLSRHIKYALVAGIVIFFIMQFIKIIIGAKVEINFNLFTQFLYYIFYSIVLYTVNVESHMYLDKKFENKYNSKRIILGFSASVVLTLISIFFLRITEEVLIEGAAFSDFLNEERALNYIIPFIITVIVTLFFIIFSSYKEMQDKKVNEQKIIAGTANAKYSSLKSQLDPHFLFNSLNVLTSLIEENPDRAQKFTTSLSKVYRYVLEQKDKDLVSLEEELKFANTYMTLLKMRFEDSIHFNIPETVKDSEAKIVPLSLQILLENCIKHNVVSEERPLVIDIIERNGVLIVSNNLQIKRTLNSSSGIGLNNIYERYKILSSRNMEIIKTDKKYTVSLPLLTKKSSIMTTNPASSTPSSFRYENARKRLDNLKGLYWSIISYVIVIPALLILNYKTSWDAHKWFVYPMFFWGMGILFQVYEVYGNGKFGKSWEDRKMKEFMEEEQNQTNLWE